MPMSSTTPWRWFKTNLKTWKPDPIFPGALLGPFFDHKYRCGRNAGCMHRINGRWIPSDRSSHILYVSRIPRFVPLPRVAKRARMADRMAERAQFKRWNDVPF